MELPESIQITDEDARQAFVCGYRHQREEELDAAIRQYRLSLEYERTAEAHTFLGWALSQQDRLDEAIRQCKQAIDVDPDFGNSYNDIGVYRLQKGDMRGALPWFRMALDAPRYESYCFPHFNLGRIYLTRGQFDRAARHFRKALEERPDFEKARVALHRVRSRSN